MSKGEFTGTVDRTVVAVGRHRSHLGISAEGRALKLSRVSGVIVLRRPTMPDGRSRGRRWVVAAFALVLIAHPLTGRASDATDWFDAAVRSELDGGGGPEKAFALYLRAAQVGLPEAEFNVAVMYDSGRGVGQDVAQAALWYARAATHGNHRAAYNLGQLYETGQGVPLNADLARSWFTVCDLPAARDHLAATRVRTPSGTVLSAPTPVAPSSGSTVDQGMGGLELVWTSKPQPEAVRFFVELRSVDHDGSHEVFSGATDTSGVLATTPDMKGDYAWRVLAVAREASHYAASDWQRFTVAPK